MSEQHVFPLFPWQQRSLVDQFFTVVDVDVVDMGENGLQTMQSLKI